MKRAWKKIEALIKSNAKHRKGFRLKEVDLPFVLTQAALEFNELVLTPDDPTEMADLLGILIHYCIKQGWTIELIESLMVEKLNLRFNTKQEHTTAQRGH